MNLSSSDIENYRKWHEERDRQRKEEAGIRRKAAFEHACDKLSAYFSAYPDTHVYLFGSVVRNTGFRKDSDIDIAVENFPGNRIDLYCDLSAIIDYPIDIVIMEKCHFADEIKTRGIKIK
jgi:predicted nucleotidyltransferase